MDPIHPFFNVANTTYNKDISQMQSSFTKMTSRNQLTEITQHHTPGWHPSKYIKTKDLEEMIGQPLSEWTNFLSSKRENIKKATQRIENDKFNNFINNRLHQLKTAQFLKKSQYNGRVEERGLLSSQKQKKLYSNVRMSKSSAKVD